MAFKYNKNLTTGTDTHSGLFDTIGKYNVEKVMLDDTLRIITDKKTGVTRNETYKEMLERNYKRLAKMADQRLVRLEQSEAKNSKYKNIKDFAYRRAMEDLKAFATKPGEDVTRFNRAKPKNIQTLTAKINSMLTFLNSITSTKSGIDKLYNTRAKTINEKFGTNFTWEDMYYWFSEMKLAEEWKHYASDEILILIGIFNKSPKDIIDEILKAKGKYGLSEKEIKELDDSNIKKLYSLRDKESLTNDEINSIFDMTDGDEKVNDVLKTYATKKTPKPRRK